MLVDFQANCLPTLIGSLPLDNHGEAMDLVMTHSPKIPLWVQLPGKKKEGMIPQFMPGLPGMVKKTGDPFMDTAAPDFSDHLLRFYEDYMAVIGGEMEIEASRFVLKEEEAGGFYALLKKLETDSPPPVALKGQVTGPITFTTGVHDQDKRAIYYHPEARDAAVKLLALKASWQVRRLSVFNKPVLIFLDEPSLTGYGSSEFMTMTREDVLACLNEVIEAIHSQKGLAGIHVCGNTDWSLILESAADIISFDAYSFFDRFILFPDLIKKFMDSGKILAWGIVPTAKAEDIEKESIDSITVMWNRRARELERLGIVLSQIQAQSLITPSCGTGPLSLDHAVKVLKMTRGVSKNLKPIYA